MATNEGDSVLELSLRAPAAEGKKVAEPIAPPGPALRNGESLIGL
jgi:hypothetical protein